MAMPIVPAIVALSIWSGGLLQELSQISTEVCCTPRRRYLQHRWRLNSVCRRMTTIRRFTCDDLFTFNRVNLDYFTETYDLPFYLNYLARWPELCHMAEGPHQQAAGYIIGKAEGEGARWHGHVTAVTVAPEYRKQGLARKLMDMLEEITEKVHAGYFVDLFVRVSNTAAIQMYKKFGYTVYRQVLGYYSGKEAAYDMRKAMSRDVDKLSIIPLKRPILPSELEHD